MKALVGILRGVARSAVGDELKDALPDPLRRTLRIEPPFLKRPLQRFGSFSDLFPWFATERMETRLDVLNLPSVLLPDEPVTDSVSLLIQNRDGALLKEHTLILPPFGSQTLLIGDVVPRGARDGTFLIFHEPDRGDTRLARFGGFLVDRQYVGYRRRGDAVWNYVHGNYAAIFRGRDRVPRSQVSRQTGQRWFAPQLRFDDCDAYTIIYTNAAAYPVTVEIDYEDAGHVVLETVHYSIAPRGLLTVERDNAARREVHIRTRSNIPFLRPYFLKRHGDTFDLLHS